jgi:hypothetical protein
MDVRELTAALNGAQNLRKRTCRPYYFISALEKAHEKVPIPCFTFSRFEVILKRFQRKADLKKSIPKIPATTQPPSHITHPKSCRCSYGITSPLGGLPLFVV